MHPVAVPNLQTEGLAWLGLAWNQDSSHWLTIYLFIACNTCIAYNTAVVMYTLVVLLDTVRNTIISIHLADVCHGINQVNVDVQIVRNSIHRADVVIIFTKITGVFLPT